MGSHVTVVGYERKEAERALKKHAATIHCSNSLSLLQRKISNALLYHAYKDLMTKDEHEITIKQLCRLIGYQGNNHSAIKEAFKELLATLIEWNLINDESGREDWTASSIIASVSLQGPLCYYSYSHRMKQLLHSPAMFGKIDLVIQSRFRSSYGLALYENCIRYCGLPHTKWFEMEVFRKLMGVPAGKYGIFRDFKRRVLDKAIDEVNAYSDLYIQPEFIREKRSVVKIRFLLKEREKKIRLGKNSSLSLTENPLVEEINPQEKLALLLAQDYGLSAEQIAQLISEYPVDFIQDKMAMIEASKSYQAGKVQNIAGYLLSAIKNNYQAPQLKLTKTARARSAEYHLIECQKRIEKIRAAYRDYRELTVQKALHSLSAAEHTFLMEQFFAFAEPAIATILKLQRNRYSRETILESPQIQALLRQFTLRELDNLVLLSLEEFVTNLNEEERIQWQTLKAADPDHPLLHFTE